jgi:hypothetical protein
MALRIPSTCHTGTQANPAQPWSGVPPEQCVRELLVFIACRLASPASPGGDCEHPAPRPDGPDGALAARLRSLNPRKFNVVRVGAPSNEEERLLAAVRDALLCRGGALTVSRDRLIAFYTLAIPPNTHIPCIVQVGTVCHSWFVPNIEETAFSSCLNYSDSLRLTVLADAMFYPAGGDSVHPGPALSTEEAALHARLGEIAEIVRFIQSSVRCDPETRGLRVRDRLEILRITQEALRGGPGAAGATAATRAAGGAAQASAVAAREAAAFPAPPPLLHMPGFE